MKKAPKKLARTCICKIKIEGFPAHVLMDTGSMVTIVKGSLLNRLPAPVKEEKVQVVLKSVSGHTIPVTRSAALEFSLGDDRMEHRAYLCSDMQHDAIIGYDFMQRHRLAIDAANQCVRLATGDEIPLRDMHGPSQGFNASLAFTRPDPDDPTSRTSSQQGEQDRPVLEPGLGREEQATTTSRTKNERGASAPRENTSPGEASKAHARSEAKRSAATLVQGTTRTTAPETGREQGRRSGATREDMRRESNAKEPLGPDPGQEIQQHIEEVDTGDLAPNQRQRLLDLISAYPECFSWNGELGTCDLLEHHIELTSNKPVRRPAYQVAQTQREVIETEVREMLKKGVIEPSVSPYAAGVVLVPKKSGETRFCVDYRGLNEATKPDHYPLPLARTEIFDTLGGATIFSCLDCQQGYWQVRVAEKDRHKTAFRCFLGLYHFLKLPFGLRNAGATYQRLMSHILSGYSGKFCHCFIDDIICFSKTFEEHLKHLELIFARLAEAGIKLKPTKCVFARKSVTYLGHVVSAGELRPDPTNVEKVKDLTPPERRKQVRAFLGLASYYRSFVKDFSRRARPLTNLTRLDVPFHWGQEEETAFNDLKTVLTSEPVLALPDFSRPFILMTDGSATGLGAVLGQHYEGDAKERVIGYASRKTKRLEENYSSCELECLALVWAVQHFRPYILGRETQVVTDHWALKWLMDLKNANPRLQRWRMALQEYDLKITHKPGRRHRNADFLSRLYENHHHQDEARDDEKAEPNLEGVGRPECKKRAEEVMAVHTRSTGQELGPHGGQGQEKSAKTTTGCPPSSPSPPEVEEPGRGRSRLRARQMEDADCKKLRESLQTGDDLPKWAVGRFQIAPDGVIERTTPDIIGTEVRQVVLPASLTKAAVQDAHAGHLKAAKTLAKLKEKWFFRKMRATCIKYIDGCPTCQEKDRGRKTIAPLGRMPEPWAAWHTVAVDVLGPLPQTSKGMKYVIVLTDYMTKFVLAIATKDQTAETTAEALMMKFLEYGFPERIITDNGPNFRSRLMDQMCQLLRAAHLFTTPYHPQFDGLCERFNRTLASMLRGFVSEHQRDWDSFLPYVMYAYRTAVQESTKEAPFFLMFGRTPSEPLDMCLRQQGGPSPPEPRSAVTRVQATKPAMVTRMHVAFTHVQAHLREARHRQKKYHDRSSKERSFEVGDEVLLLDERVQEGQTKKLRSPWKPGYRIIEKIGPLNYRIEHPNRRGRILRVHVERLKEQKPEFVWPGDAALPDLQPSLEAPNRPRQLDAWLQDEKRRYKAFQEHWSDIEETDSNPTPADTEEGVEPGQARLVGPGPAAPRPVERRRGRGRPRKDRAGIDPEETPRRARANEPPIVRRSERIRIRRQLAQRARTQGLPYTSPVSDDDDAP